MQLTPRQWQAVELFMTGADMWQVARSMGISALTLRRMKVRIAGREPAKGMVGVIMAWMRHLPHQELEAFYSRCAALLESVAAQERQPTEERVAALLAECRPADVSRTYIGKQLRLNPNVLSRITSRLADRLGLPRKLRFVWLVYWGAAQHRRLRQE